VVICLEGGANDLHLVQLMSLAVHPVISCFIKIPISAPRLSWKRGREMAVCSLRDNTARDVPDCKFYYPARTG